MDQKLESNKARRAKMKQLLQNLMLDSQGLDPSTEGVPLPGIPMDLQDMMRQINQESQGSVPIDIPKRIPKDLYDQFLMQSGRKQ